MIAEGNSKGVAQALSDENLDALFLFGRQRFGDDHLFFDFFQAALDVLEALDLGRDGGEISVIAEIGKLGTAAGQDQAVAGAAIVAAVVDVVLRVMCCVIVASVVFGFAMVVAACVVVVAVVLGLLC